MNPNSVNAVCRQLIAEAEAIIKYNDDRELIKEIDEKTTKLFDDIRADELEHLQKLCIQLTELLTPEKEEGAGE